MSDIFRPSPEGESKCDPGTKVIKMSPAHVPVPRPRSGASHSGSTATTLNVQFVLSAFRRWWRVVLPCGVVLAAIGRRSRVPDVQVRSTGPRLGFGSATARRIVAFQSREDPRRFLETQMALMRSPLVIGPVVSRPEIAQLPEIQQAGDAGRLAGHEDQGGQRGQSEYVTISFESRSPVSSAMVVNAVVDTYLDLRGQDDSEQVQRVIELLEEEKDRRIREVDAMRDTVRELAKQATGKDPFAMKSRKRRRRGLPRWPIFRRIWSKPKWSGRSSKPASRRSKSRRRRRSGKWMMTDWIGRSKSTPACRS